MPQQHPRGVKTVQELAAGITPMLPGQPERIPWTWFDSQTYTSGTTVTLDFFQATNADKNLSNMVAAGQLPSPQFFDLYHTAICYLVPPSIIAAADPTALTGASFDVNLLTQGAAIFQIANKEYWEGPQLALPCGGGPVPVVSLSSTETAGEGQAYQFATNGQPDLRNRYNFWGDITIPHNQNFRWRLTWTAAITFAPATDRIIKIWMDGYLYRRVL